MSVKTTARLSLVLVASLAALSLKVSSAADEALPRAQATLIAENEALRKADLAYGEKKFGEAANLYEQVLDDPKGASLEHVLMRLYVSLAEAGRHERFDAGDLNEIPKLLTDETRRADFLRLCADYYARRDHSYFFRKGFSRLYGKKYSDIPEAERSQWQQVDTTRDDLERAQPFAQRALDLLNKMAAESANRPEAERKALQLKLLHATLDYCDLTELKDRISGKCTLNHRNFFGPDYRGGSQNPEPVEKEEDEKAPPVSEPGEEPFTRRGYYYEPAYENLPAITANFMLAERMAKDTGDADLQALVIYRRACLCITAGLYGSAKLNAVLTDWANAKTAEPEPALDPRPHLRKLIKQFPKCAFVDEAQFLLGYVGYYLNDFDSAHAEFAALEKNFPKSKYLGEARRLRDVISFPQCFSTLEGGALITPSKPASVSVFCRNVERVSIALREFDLGALVEGADPGEGLFTKLDDIEKLPGFEKAIGRATVEQTFNPNPARKHFYDRFENIPLYTSRPGTFILEIKAGPITERKLVQIADLALTRRREASRDLFWLTTGNGQPIIGAKISGAFIENTHSYVPFQEEEPVDPKDPSKGMAPVVKTRAERRLLRSDFRGKTSDLGLFTVDTPPRGIRSLWAAITVEGRTFLVNDLQEPLAFNERASWEMPEAPAPKPRDLRCFVYTDRPIYRTGDKSYLRVIVRDPSARASLKGEHVLVVLSAGGLEQFRQEVALNEFGAAVVEYIVPPGAPLGDWRIDAINERFEGRAVFTLKVEEYVKRDITLKIDAPSQPIAATARCEIPISLSFLAGGAVTDATVNWTITASHAVSGQTVNAAAGSATTNADGRVFAALDAAAVSAAFKGGAAKIDISADAVGPGGQRVTAKASAFVSGKGVKLEVHWPDGNWVQAADCELEAQARDAQGKVLLCRGIVRHYQIVGESSLRPSAWRSPALRLYAQAAFEVNADGEKIGLRNLPTGRWRIEIEGVAGDEVVKAVKDLVVVGPQPMADAAFEAVPEYDVTDCAQPLKVLICNPGRHVVLCGMFKNGSGGEERLLQLPELAIQSFDFAEQHAPWVNLDLRRVRNGAIENASCGVRVEPISRRVFTKVNFDKSRYTPGETATADIFTFDHSGKPVEAEVALSVWDSALKEFAQSALAQTDLFAHFFATASFAGVTAVDQVVSARTEVAPSRKNDARVKRWRVHAMPAGSFFWGSLSWTSTRATPYSVLYAGVVDEPTFYGEAGPSLEFSSDDHNEDPTEDPRVAEDPYYGENADEFSDAVYGGGSGGRGGSGGMSHRRARGGGARSLANEKTREDFRDSALFAVTRTSAEGVAQIKFTLPDNLTDWSYEATATDKLAGIGQTSGSFAVSKMLMVRMVGPRGLTEGDEVELCALVQNMTDEAAGVDVKLALNVEPAALAQLTLLSGAEAAQANLAPQGTSQIRWRVKIAGFGKAALMVSAASEENADTLVWKYAVEPRGVQTVAIKRFEFAQGQSQLEIAPELPPGLIFERSSLAVQIDSGILASCVDALPKLVAYPYGCVEQTIHRFVPLLDAIDILRANGLTLYDLAKTRGDYGSANAGDSWPQELRDRAKVQEMLSAGFGRLRGYQHSDGGWGWWENDESRLHNSAIVLTGLCRARILTRQGQDLALPASEPVVENMLLRATAFVLGNVADEGDATLQNRGLFAASLALSLLPSGSKAQPHQADSLRVLLAQMLRAQGTRENRGGSLGEACYCLALWHSDSQRDAKAQLEALSKLGVDDGKGGLSYGKSGGYSHGFDDPLEAQGLAIEAFSMIDPKNRNLGLAIKSLQSRRSDGWWGNTRATGVAIAALARFIKANGESAEEVSVDIGLGNVLLGSFSRGPKNLLAPRSRFEVAGTNFAQNAQGKLTLRRKGNAPISGTITVRGYVPLEKNSEAVENGLKLTRQYFRRVAVTREVYVEVQNERGKVLRRYKEMRTEYDDKPIGESELKVGELVTVRLTLSGASGRKYLAVSDPRPSCLEPISAKSVGDITREDRDARTLFYLTEVRDTDTVLEYQAVVTTGGKFTALPALSFDMYAEESWGRSAATALSVK